MPSKAAHNQAHFLAIRPRSTPDLAEVVNAWPTLPNLPHAGQSEATTRDYRLTDKTKRLIAGFKNNVSESDLAEKPHKTAATFNRQSDEQENGDFYHLMICPRDCARLRSCAFGRHVDLDDTRPAKGVYGGCAGHKVGQRGIARTSHDRAREN